MYWYFYVLWNHHLIPTNCFCPFARTGTCTYFETTLWFSPTVSARLHRLSSFSWVFLPDIWSINSINSTFSQNVRIQTTQFSVLSLGIPFKKWRNVSLQSARPTPTSRRGVDVGRTLGSFMPLRWATEPWTDRPNGCWKKDDLNRVPCWNVRIYIYTLYSYVHMYMFFRCIYIYMDL